MRQRHLHVVTTGPAPTGADRPRHGGDRGDLGVMAMLFGVNLVPLFGAAFTHGRWGPGTVGLATAGALVTGRELLLGARAVLERRR